ncbi:MAG TPA: hypothetical protein EYH42_07860 [Sulfurovum sp.]|nr:hypothetical protein [Sulfurovum sp.]
MKVFIFLLLNVFYLHALSPTDLVGNWYAVTQSGNNGTETIEKEYLNLRVDHTFSIVLLVSVQKDDAYVKDLHIEASGIWKNRDNILVVVIKKIEVPYAKKVHLISQKSLENLSNYFKDKFHQEPIRISIVKNATTHTVTLVSENLRETVYNR